METKKKSLLIVEDEVGIRSALNYIFEDDGYRVITATDGRDAIHKIKNNIIDLVITDIVMPELDGLELVGYSKKYNPLLKSIVVSGGDPQFLQVSQVMVADRVLSKPFGQEELKQLVNELI